MAVLGLLAMTAGGWALQREASTATTADGWCSSCHQEDGSLAALEEGGHDEVDCAVCHEARVVDQAREGVALLFGAARPESPHRVLAHRGSCVSCHVGESAEAETRVEGIAVHEAHGVVPGDDPILDPLGRPEAPMECTSCHLVEGHGFAPETVGCTAARCHSDAEIRLGGMAHQGLDCADCHALGATVQPGDSLLLRPTGAQCVECHSMAELRPDFDSSDDPHGDDCAACHQPHRQFDLSEAGTTCTNSGCHTRPDTLVASHRGLAPGVLEGCTGCHTPHRAQVDPQDCAACHGPDGGLLPGVSGPAPLGTPGATGRGIGGLDPLALPSAGASPGGGGGPVGAGLGLRPMPRALLDALVHRVAAADTVLPARFLHEEHLPVDCASCHVADGTEHGELSIRSASDCRSCHHLADDAPDCVTCHEGREPGGAGLVREVRFDLGVLASAAHRSIDFSHETHAAEECATCHLPSETRSAAAEDCQGCHVEHHEAALDCASCHLVAPEAEHPVAQVHVGCAGSGCHEAAPAPLADRARDRVLCVGCHEEQRVEHYDPAAPCTNCHLLPPPRSWPAGSSPGVLPSDASHPSGLPGDGARPTPPLDGGRGR